MRQLKLAIIAGLGALLAACGSDSSDHAEHINGHTVSLNEEPATPTDYVDNFVLLDQNGEAHELYYHQDAEAIVLLVQGNGCPIVRNIAADFKAVRTAYQDRNVRFAMLNANPQDSRADIAAEVAEYRYDMPVLKDETQLIAASLDITRTAEVIVIDPETWQIAYRGPVNDRLAYERQRPEAKSHYLADALDAVLAGEPVERVTRRTKGCVVNLRDAHDTEAHAQISYSETIAPMLIENCVTCHQPGGIGPWAMTDYDMIEGFAPTIRDVVRTRRMPPWSADPTIGEFHNARALSTEEKQTLVRWIEAGAPRGEGPDPLAELNTEAPEWPLGPPDLIVEAPAFDVPATGVVDYQFPTALNPLDRDVWVKAVTVLPGDPAVVHHALVGSSENITAPGEGDDGDVFENYLVGFVPGSSSYEYPENTGVLVKAGGEYRFQMHYTPSGKPTTDKTRIGLYFHDEKPEHVLRQQVAINFNIKIPAGSRSHTEQAYFEFDDPADIYLLFPHAHFRGKASKFEVQYPDGRTEPILSVPRYDFNWQHNYALAEPISVPAGARLVHTTEYDNSEYNFANPNPERDVPWGLQSADEMLYGSFFFRWSEETHDNPVHDPLRFNLRQYWGFADANMNGELERSEVWGGFARSWDAGDVAPADSDGSGTLSFEEFYQMQLARRRRR